MSSIDTCKEEVEEEIICGLPVPEIKALSLTELNTSRGCQNM